MCRVFDTAGSEVVSGSGVVVLPRLGETTQLLAPCFSMGIEEFCFRCPSRLGETAQLLAPCFGDREK